MDLKEPYYRKNKEWYYYDENEEKDKLTNKAPEKAIESYNKFYEMLEMGGLDITDEDIEKMREEIDEKEKIFR